jgi:CO/xanthine dehydrogenase Mo-binding subunit
MAAAEAKSILLASDAEMLEVDIGTLEVRDSKIYASGVESETTIGDVVGWTRGGGKKRLIQATGYNQINISPGQTIRTCHANFVEVEVDTETGELTVENVVSVSDIGRALNPMSCENQLEGGFIMGMTIAEDIIRDYETGVSLNSNYLTYKMPTFNDCGPIECILVEKHDPTCPYGAKGIGEPCTIPASGAITNAIYNAIGVRMEPLWPPTPDNILKALGKI